MVGLVISSDRCSQLLIVWDRQADVATSRSFKRTHRSFWEFRPRVVSRPTVRVIFQKNPDFLELSFPRIILHLRRLGELPLISSTELLKRTLAKPRLSSCFLYSKELSAMSMSIFEPFRDDFFGDAMRSLSAASTGALSGEPASYGRGILLDIKEVRASGYAYIGGVSKASHDIVGTAPQFPGICAALRDRCLVFVCMVDFLVCKLCNCGIQSLRGTPVEISQIRGLTNFGLRHSRTTHTTSKQISLVSQRRLSR